MKIDYIIEDRKSTQEFHPNLWETLNKDFPKFSVKEKERIVSLIRGLCPHCLDGDINCNCWLEAEDRENEDEEEASHL